jgi:5-methylcytosine-specific restriction endonuclease McrA
MERLPESAPARSYAGRQKRGHVTSLLTYCCFRSRSSLALGETVNDVLVLNFTYEALNITSFQRAVKLIFCGKAEIVHRRDEILMLYYIKRPMQKVALTKKNVLLRDDYTCQYCNLKGERMMTVDHVLPRSKGGASTWENLVCACMRCNNRKNNRTPEHANMRLKRKPKAPKYIPWIRVKRNTLPGEWHQFLFLYNVSIEEKVEAP